MTNGTRGDKAFDAAAVINGRGAGQSKLDLPANHTVYAQGDPANSLFYVAKGWVKMSVVVPNGKEAMVTPRGAGEYFGTRVFVDRRRWATAATLTDCTLVQITRPAMIRLIRQNPDFAEEFAISQAKLGIRDNASFIEYLTAPAEQRLMRILTRLAGDGDKTGALTPPISQTLLAAMVGTTRSRVSLFMNKFRRQGLIDYGRDGRIVVQARLADGFRQR
jgi:CRP-like cAMP-binding protein